MKIDELRKLAERKLKLNHENPLINRMHIEPELILKMLDVIKAANMMIFINTYFQDSQQKTFIDDFNKAVDKLEE